MTKKTTWFSQTSKMPLVLSVMATASAPVSAFQFYMGDVEASIDTTLSAGASWRLQDQSSLLVGKGNGGDGASINSDNGNLNFEKGETYSKIVKGNTDFLFQYEDYGVFARAKYWYDRELKDEGRAFSELSEEGSGNASGAEILDAYIWADMWLGDSPLSLRLGKQVLSWGESTFIFNGINIVNPVDVGALRAPGAEIKEALLPVNMFYASLGITDDLTVEGFVQLEYEKSRIDDCGTFFSTIDYVADGCGPVLGVSSQSEQANNDDNIALQRLGDIEPDDTDQFGLAVRLYAPELNETEFGFYFVQYHSRLPIVSGVVATTPSTTANPIAGFDPVTGGKYFIEYPEQIQMLGLSFNTTTPNGISIGGEYSMKKDYPVQLNSPDLVIGAIGNPSSPIFQTRVPDTVDALGNPGADGLVTGSDAVAGNFFGNVQNGYELFDISQLQFTAISFVDQIMGASRLTLVGEVGATYVHDLPELSELRFGRFDQTGFGLTPDYFGTGDAVALATCQALNSATNPQCNSEGYVTDFSWGYRGRATLVYNDVFAGVNLSPQLNWSHDVQGYAPGPGANFIEGRKSIGLSVSAEYLNQYKFNVAYTNYFGSKLYNAIHDRDNVSLSASYSF